MPLNLITENKYKVIFMRQISITVPETAHWHALIGKAEHVACHLLPQGIEDYLIRLFMRTEQQETIVLCDALDQEKSETTPEEKLQRLADQCLMLCGFYPEASEEYGVPMDEFISMGIESYKKLASLEYGESEIVYEYLTQNFVQVSELLCFISSLSDGKMNKKVYQKIETNEEVKIPLKPAGNISFSSPISHRILN